MAVWSCLYLHSAGLVAASSLVVVFIRAIGVIRG